MPKKHLSFTQLKMFARCPAQWYFRYVQGLKIPPTGAMFIGKRVDDGIAFNMEQKIESHEDRATVEVLDFLDTAFEKDKGSVEDWGQETPGEVKDSGYKALEKYHTENCPIIQPDIVQGELFIPLQGIPYDFIGYMDLVDDKKIIIDNKVVGKSPTKNKATGLHEAHPIDIYQIASYAIGYEYQYKQKPGGIRLDYLVRTKTPQVHQINVKPKKGGKDSFLRMIAYVSHDIEQATKSGIFLPRGRLSFTQDCLRCGYAEICRKEI